MCPFGKIEGPEYGIPSIISYLLSKGSVSNPSSNQPTNGKRVSSSYIPSIEPPSVCTPWAVAHSFLDVAVHALAMAIETCGLIPDSRRSANLLRIEIIYLIDNLICILRIDLQ